MPTDALKIIREKAVQLEKEHPRMSYQQRLKKAGAMYRKGELGGVKKPEKRSVTKVERITTVGASPKRLGRSHDAVIAAHKKGLAILKNIERLELERKEAKGREAKNFIQRVINSEHKRLDKLF